MNRYVAILVLITCFSKASAQVIKGTVYDTDTKSRISFAYVYFSGTFTGTNTDRNGNFTLDISKYPSMPLTVSALGYNSVSLKTFSAGKALNIYLKPKLFELSEVVISSKSGARERMESMRLFKEAFLGTTRNSRDCEITNEEDIMFRTVNDTLTAYSSNPVLIENRALGYRVTYFLDEFTYCRRGASFFFSGSIIFNEDLSGDPEQRKNIESRRRHTYLGSRMHFFRSLWNNSLDSTRFVVVDPMEEKLLYSSIVTTDDSLTKYLEYPEALGICYDTGSPSSYIIFLEDLVYFDRNGYFDPYGISWQGEMSRQRIADWLPYEYVYK